MVLAFLVILSGFLLTAQNVFAVSVDISNVPSSISDQPFNVDVSVSGASAGTNYLRIDLYKDGTINYFGETYNGSSWYNGSDGKQFFPITILSGQTWTGTIQGRIGTPSSTDYPGPDIYKLKVRRYTASGTPASSDTQTPQDISINYSSATPIPSPTPTSPTNPTPTTTSSSFTISNIPSSINSNQTFSVSIDLNLPSNLSTSFYIKGAFKKSDNSNYFGLTKVGSNWIKNGSTYSEQLSITTDSSGHWTGNIEVQPDAADSGFEGSGQYVFKVGRYTESGSGPTWSNEITLNINQVSSPTTSPSSTPSPIPSVKPTISPVSKTTVNLKNNLASVAGITKESTPSSISSTLTPTKPPEIKSQKQFNPFLMRHKL